MIWHRHVQSTHLSDAKDITQILNMKSRSFGQVVAVLGSYRCSGVPAFVELIRADSLQVYVDPVTEQLRRILG